MEEFAQLRGRHADARVAHGEAEVGHAIPDNALDVEADLALLRELVGVAEKVEQALAQLGDVGADGSDVRPQGDDELVLPLLDEWCDGVANLADNVRHLEAFEVQFHLLRLDLGEVEDLVDEMEQVLGGIHDSLQVIRRLRAAIGLRLGQQHLGEADDGRERCAQLVAHAGEEGTLRAVRALGLLARLLGELSHVAQLAGALGDFAFQREIRVFQLRVGALEVARHRFERVRQHADLVLRTDIELRGYAKIPGGELAGGLGHALERLGDPRGEPRDDEDAQQHHAAGRGDAAVDDRADLFAHLAAGVCDGRALLGQRVAQPQDAPALNAHDDGDDHFEDFGFVHLDIARHGAGLSGGGAVVRAGVLLEFALLVIDQRTTLTRVNQRLRIGVEDNGETQLCILGCRVGDRLGSRWKRAPRDKIGDLSRQLPSLELADFREGIALLLHAFLRLAFDELLAPADLDPRKHREQAGDEAHHRDHQLPTNATADLCAWFHELGRRQKAKGKRQK